MKTTDWLILGVGGWFLLNNTLNTYAAPVSAINTIQGNVKDLISAGNRTIAGLELKTGIDVPLSGLPNSTVISMMRAWNTVAGAIGAPILGAK